MTARDLAHIMTLATKGLKASTVTAAELRRMTDGLIAWRSPRRIDQTVRAHIEDRKLS